MRYVQLPSDPLYIDHDTTDPPMREQVSLREVMVNLFRDQQFQREVDDDVWRDARRAVMSGLDGSRVIELRDQEHAVIVKVMKRVTMWSADWRSSPDCEALKRCFENAGTAKPDDAKKGG
jgi:hypothetical protein